MSSLVPVIVSARQVMPGAWFPEFRSARSGRRILQKLIPALGCNSKREALAVGKSTVEHYGYQAELAQDR